MTIYKTGILSSFPAGILRHRAWVQEIGGSTVYFLGCVWVCICVWVLPGYLEPCGHHF